MQNLNNGSILFIFIKSCYKKTKLSVGGAFRHSNLGIIRVGVLKNFKNCIWRDCGN